MPNKINTKLHLERHSKMLDYQKKIEPFTPSVRELQRIWNLRTTSATWLTLKRLEGLGLIISRNISDKSQYFAIKAKG